MDVLTRSRRHLARLKHAARRVFESFYRSTLPQASARAASRVRREGLTYLSLPKLDKLGNALLGIERRHIEGAIIEAGCALGGSAILLASCKAQARPLRIYDVFGMIPPPSSMDGRDVHERYEVISSGKSRGLKGQRYYGYESDLQQRVRANFERCGYPQDEHAVEMIAGKVEDTMAVDGPIALAHIDVDWYLPVMTCLERIAPRLSRGGVIVLDDYFDWSGCRKATDDFIARTNISFARDAARGSLALTRL